MKKKLILSCCLCLTVSIYLPAQVEKISYRDWSDCYSFGNDSIGIIVNTSAMGNIPVFEKKGVNFMWEDQTINGKLLGDAFQPDAGRFDYGPEQEVMLIHDITWKGPYAAEIIDDYTLEITSLEDTEMGIQTTRLFELDSIRPYLKITQTMTNISDANTNYYFWGRTLIPTGGKLFSPVNPESSLEDKWVRYIWGNPTTFSSDPDDPGVEIDDSLFTMIPEEAANSKYGTDSESGWMAYGYQGMIFLKTYGYYPDETYTVENGLTNLFYRKIGKFAEMEPVSPAMELAPGESYSFVENWYLIDYSPASVNSFDASEASGYIFDYLATYDKDSTTGGDPSFITGLSRNDRLNIYPCPASGSNLNVSWNIDMMAKASIEIYNFQGVLVNRQLNAGVNSDGKSVQVNISSLPAGNYIIRIKSHEENVDKFGKFSIVK
jgi:hypothetical protein